MQRIGKWGQRGKETLAVHEVGEAAAMVRSLRELEWREEKGGGEGIRSTGRRASCCVPQKKKKEGVRYADEGEDREPIGCGKEGESALCECTKRVLHSQMIAERKWVPISIASVGHVETVTQRA